MLRWPGRADRIGASVASACRRPSAAHECLRAAYNWSATRQNVEGALVAAPSRPRRRRLEASLLAISYEEVLGAMRAVFGDAFLLGDEHETGASPRACETRAPAYGR